MFALLFHNDQAHQPNEHDELVDLVLSHNEKIDAMIQKNAPRYPLDRIAKIDLCILRLAIYEMTIDATQPPKVVIDEAVTLAREFGGDRSYAFINAVLGAVYQDTFGEEAPKTSVPPPPKTDQPPTGTQPSPDSDTVDTSSQPDHE